MDQASLFILVIGLIIVLSQGAMLSDVGKAFLEKAYPEPGRAKTVATLLVAPAFLLTLGALLLVSVIGIDPGDGLPVVLARVGVIFLAAAAMHLVALVLVVRDKREAEHIEQVEEELHHRP